MFRGGDYVDKDGFFDTKSGRNNMDVSDINVKKPKGTLGNAG